MRTILILAANPNGTNRLRLDEEVKRIKQALRRANKRDQFRVVDEWAVTDDDLRQALLDNEPEVVHFAGHGTGDGHVSAGRDLGEAEVDAGGLAFEDDVGSVQLIPGDALARLFELCSESVKCVILNACYSEVQANAIAQHIPFVVGMNKAIGDPAAIKFAAGFYDALFSGRDFERRLQHWAQRHQPEGHTRAPDADFEEEGFERLSCRRKPTRFADATTTSRARNEPPGNPGESTSREPARPVRRGWRFNGGQAANLERRALSELDRAPPACCRAVEEGAKWRLRGPC